MLTSDGAALEVGCGVQKVRHDDSVVELDARERGEVEVEALFAVALYMLYMIYEDEADLWSVLLKLCCFC